MRRLFSFIRRRLALPLLLATTASAITWLATTPRPRAVITDGGGRCAVQFVSSGAFLLCVDSWADSAPRTYTVHDVATGAEFHRFRRAPREPWGRTFEDAGTLLEYVCAGDDGDTLILRRRDLRSGAVTELFHEKLGKFVWTGGDPNDKALAARLDPNTPAERLEVWDVPERKRVLELPGKYEVKGIWNDGQTFGILKQVAELAQELEVWDVDTPQCRWRRRLERLAYPIDVACAPDGRSVAVSDASGLTLLDTSDGAVKDVTSTS